jgi:hypothetical protein
MKSIKEEYSRQGELEGYSCGPVHLWCLRGEEWIKQNKEEINK